jgi:transcriptional regulator with XRE-family HTH domain
LQQRRESAGYSRTRIGELVGVKPGTIEGWELGRVSRPPIHDFLRLALFLSIPTDEIQRAVLDDAGDVQAAAALEEQPQLRARGSRPPSVALLDAAFQLTRWASDIEAADVLGVSAEDVRAWRRGSHRMDLATYLTLTSIIALAAVAALRDGEARSADLAAAAQALGVTPISSE